MKVKLKILDPTTCQISEGLSIIKECLSYPSEIWRKGKFHKIKKEITKDFVFGRKEKYVYTGFLSKIKSYCEKRNILFEVEGKEERLTPTDKANLLGIEIRNYQLKAIDIAVEKQRGIIQAATRSGKSIIAVGIASCFKDHSVLFLAPTIDIVNEIYDTFTNCGFKACKLGEGNKEIAEDIVISTIQTYSKLDLLKLSDRFSIVFADEIHLRSDAGGELDKILSTCLAPMRIGFSATIPKKLSKQLLLQGLLGDVLMELSVKDGIEKYNILAKPKIEFLSIPTSKEIKKLTTYRSIYQAGIIDNQVRNNIIARYVRDANMESKSALIFCNNLDHIKNLSSSLNRIGVLHGIVEGKVSGEKRGEIKDKLNTGEIKCVISSTVWTEGITLPNISIILNASGQKSEERLIQKMGRGLGKTKNKEEVVLVDILDPYRFLAEHTIERLSIYKKMGWL